jgi:hypothetical protein
MLDVYMRYTYITQYMSIDYMRSSALMPILDEPASPQEPWSDECPAMRNLLDHIAEILAQEYVHLMKSSVPRKEEG